MFKREHHIRIATLLQSLNADLLEKNGCLFGGGTAIVLARGEYRESVDIDFLVSDRQGYQNLRHLLTGQGIAAITQPGFSITSTREVRVDQYGIRTMLAAGKTEIKFKIAFESRMNLEAPDPLHKICGVSTLTSLDMATSKLLANSDRWSDDSVFNRDLIDLAMIGLPKDQLQLAIDKASDAYGESIQRDLDKAIEKLSQRRGRLEECMVALKIDTIPKAVLWKNIRELRTKKSSFS